MENKLIYIAVDDDGCVLNVNINRDDCEKFVMDYYGINPDKTYSSPSICNGFTKIDYRHFEDDLEGYWTFLDNGKNYRVNLWCKILNEKE